MFELPKLNYKYNALEPYIDEETMRIHHSKHHQAYTDNFNKAIGETEESAEDIIADIDEISEDKRTAVRNNGGGYINHKLFFSLLKKDVECRGEILRAINKKFGSFDKFKEEFGNAAKTQFGSGWAWLVVDEGELKIVKTSNQDSPLSDGKKPILCIDVWEHSYYLKYQNRRPEYIENFFHVINWNKVNELFLEK
ncbi:superoxide dismutase [Candidatus Woesearchaeota archaeon]|nr:superoxide dismutase [Candidatus Woesearchaeota archaeon]